MSELKPGDIVLVRSEGFVSKVIRFFTRVPHWEPRTEFNHVEMISTEGDITEVNVVSADRGGVTERPIFPFHAGKTIEIWRVHLPPHRLGNPEHGKFTIEERREAAVRYMDSKLGTKYPVWRLFTWIFDWATTMGLGETFFWRRLTQSHKRTCGHLVAWAWWEGGKIKVSKRDSAYTSPDDIHDHLTNPNNNGWYERVDHVQA